MGFKRFAFTRDWRNAKDFAAVVNDENQVRADMQALHDEAKEGLNALMAELETSGAAGLIGAVDSTDEAREGTTVQGALDKMAEAVAEVAQINAENLGSQNIALDKPGEDTLAKAFGLTSMVPMVHDALGALAPLGLGVDALAQTAGLSSHVDNLKALSGIKASLSNVSALSSHVPNLKALSGIKANLSNVADLSSHVANLKALSGIKSNLSNVANLSSHVANLSKLSPTAQYMEHWWMRRKAYSSSGYTLGAVQMPDSTGGYYAPYLVKHDDFSGAKTVYYGTKVHVTSGGALVISDETSKSFSAKTSADMSVLVGKYVRYSNGDIWYIPSGAKPVYNSKSSYYYTTMSKYQVVTVDKVDRVWEYLSSEKEDAYPKNTIQDGYEYRYIGLPLSNTVHAAKITAGTYVGDGKYGEGSKNKLTLPFTPEFVIVCLDGSFPDDYYRQLVVPYGCTQAFSATKHGLAPNTSYSGAYRVSLAWDGSTVSWFSTGSAIGQLNENGKAYRYVAIGM